LAKHCEVVESMGVLLCPRGDVAVGARARIRYGGNLTTMVMVMWAAVLGVIEEELGGYDVAKSSCSEWIFAVG
jgi:hypothetical protein